MIRMDVKVYGYKSSFNPFKPVNINAADSFIVASEYEFPSNLKKAQIPISAVRLVKFLDEYTSKEFMVALKKAFAAKTLMEDL